MIEKRMAYMCVILFLLCITGDREAGIIRIQKAHNFKLAPFVLLYYWVVAYLRLEYVTKQ